MYIKKERRERGVEGRVGGGEEGREREEGREKGEGRDRERQREGDRETETERETERERDRERERERASERERERGSTCRTMTARKRGRKSNSFMYMHLCICTHVPPGHCSIIKHNHLFVYSHPVFIGVMSAEETSDTITNAMMRKRARFQSSRRIPPRLGTFTTCIGFSRLPAPTVVDR